MKNLVIQILLDNAPWPAPERRHSDRAGMPAWPVREGLFICHPDGGLIYLPLVELLQMVPEEALSAAVPALMV